MITMEAATGSPPAIVLVEIMVMTHAIPSVIAADPTTAPSTTQPITAGTNPATEVSVPIYYLTIYIVVGGIYHATTPVIAKLYRADSNSSRSSIINSLGTTCAGNQTKT
jgi:hypothetical protein